MSIRIAKRIGILQITIPVLKHMVWNNLRRVLRRRLPNAKTSQKFDFVRTQGIPTKIPPNKNTSQTDSENNTKTERFKSIWLWIEPSHPRPIQSQKPSKSFDDLENLGNSKQK